MKKVLITGATGFVGQHLTAYLSSKNEFEIFGTSLSDSGSSNNNINLEKIDLLESEEVAKLIEKIKPDFIYHLAAFSSAGDSYANSTKVVLSNVEIQMNILNAVKDSDLIDTRTLVVSSGEVYGQVDPSDLPLNEDVKLRPVNPYAVSKIAQDYLALQYNLSYQLKTISVRAFNHTGPFQTTSFAIPAFAKQIAQIEKGQQEPLLMVGSLSAKRDFSDVRDIVIGYSRLMDDGLTGETYNIGSGISRSMRELLDILLSLTDKKIEIQEDPSKLRPVSVPDVYCDYSKLKKLTGWTPKISIEKTLQDTLDYWRSVV
ncbi:MAG TPA: GDP-mannose 4,6-dehydratase [Candidatus Limnocylindrales bacterium]|nr:GDP-mannose 4,6-dehydratase [Candidatus Limnocylindrales bacterium]